MYIFGLLSVILFTFCFIPQIVSILKTKNVSGLSLWLWIMVVLGHLTALIYCIYIRDLILIVSYLMGLILSSLTLILVIYYGAKEELEAKRFSGEI